MNHSTVGRVTVAGLQPAQVVAGLVGVLLVVAGVAGFLRTGLGDFAGGEDSLLLGFAVNPLHNAVHLAFGVLGLLMAGISGLARLYGWVLFLGFGVLLVWGLMLTGIIAANPVASLGNPVAINTNDNWLSLGFVLVGLLVAVLPARRRIVVDEPGPVAEPEHHDMPEQRIEAMDPTVSPRPVEPPRHAGPPRRADKA